jgi:hypothetical protein
MRWYAVWVLVGVIGCEKKPTPVEGEPRENESAAARVIAPSASAAPAKPAPPPVLAPRVILDDQGKDEATVFKIGETLIVAGRYKVGKVTKDDKVEWIGQIPSEITWAGPNEIEWVGGESLDAIDVLYRNMNGRVSSPTYYPLNGEGSMVTLAPGGGWGNIAGVARIGASTVISGNDLNDGGRILTVRGPALERYVIPAGSQGCETHGFTKPAVSGWAFGAARNGMLVNAGSHCSGDIAAIEVWPPSEKKGKIVKLDKWMGKERMFKDVLPSGSDGLWLVPWSGGPILEFRNDTITPLPPMPTRDVAWVDGNDLYATDDAGIHRYVDGKWTLVASFPWSYDFSNVVLHEGKFWAGAMGKVVRLEPGKSTAWSESCKKPFVFIYNVSGETEPKFTFPSTRAALKTFKLVDAISLVEFYEGRRRIGITVKDESTARAVIDHLKEAMPKEKPSLICYEPKDPRVLAIQSR